MLQKTVLAGALLLAGAAAAADYYLVGPVPDKQSQASAIKTGYNGGAGFVMWGK